ncbi:MAG: DegT/DnrJ/EryC1/StrS family aminotransferase [Acidobacteria bacterium]|nr:DegT/DnrJ/EryC1/StrS family aminotransferase [Acidobacteriota bacterium]
MDETKVYVGYFELGDEARAVINKVLDAGRISEGKFTQEFEKSFAKYCNTKYSIATSSGTAALQAGLIALKYHSSYKNLTGKKIITSPLTYIATANAVHFSGYEPAFVDIDPVRFSILPEKVEELLSKSKNPAEEYKAILPVHLMGYPCDMDALKSIADKYGLVLLEDSAQAHGSSYKGRRTGSMGLFSAFSFYIAHNIQAGEMGAVTSNDEELIKLVRQIKANGRVCDCPVCTRPQGKCPHLPKDNKNDDDFDPRFTHSILGLNFKTMEFQAALGLSQLKLADKIFKARQDNVKYFNEHLKKYDEILQLPEFDRDVSYLAYPIVLKKDASVNRKHLRLGLEKNGVETRPLFGSIPTQQPAYSHMKDQYEGKLPNADYIGKRGFYIGCHQYLTEAHLEKVIKVFEKVLK